MINLLFIHSSSEMYGSDRSLLNLIRGLDKKKFIIKVILPSLGELVNELEKEENVTVEINEIAVLRRKNLSLKGFFIYVKDFISSFKYINQLVEKCKVDVIYTNTSVVLPGAVVAKFKRIKSIWHVREIIKNKFERLFISLFVNRFSDLIIANSLATANAISKNKKKLKVIYNAVEEKVEFKKNTINSNLITIGMAGRINRWKGQKLFVEAAKIVSEKYKNVIFLIAGSSYTNEEYFENELLEYISKNQLDNIKLLGLVKNMDEFYSNLDIFVLPSIQPEPFGLVVIEAMEYALPVIATNHGGPTEIIDNGDNGFLVDYLLPNELAEKMIMLINDKELRFRIGCNSQKKKRELFSLERYVSQIEEEIIKIKG